MDQNDPVELTADAAVLARRFMAAVKPRVVRDTAGRPVTTTQIAHALLRLHNLEHAVVNPGRPLEFICPDCKAVTPVPRAGVVPTRCRSCSPKASKKKWQQANPEKAAALARAWQKRNPEKAKACKHKGRKRRKWTEPELARNAARRERDRRVARDRLALGCVCGKGQHAKTCMVWQQANERRSASMRGNQNARKGPASEQSTGSL